MDYLFVLVALGSVGFLFAGLKTMAGSKKSITRLQL